MKYLIQTIAMALLVSCSHFSEVQRNTASIQQAKFSCLNPEQLVNVGVVLEFPHFPSDKETYLVIGRGDEVRDYDSKIISTVRYTNDENYRITASFSKKGFLEISVNDEDHFVKIEDGRFNYEGRELKCTIEKL